jgi:hypothetical protein
MQAQANDAENRARQKMLQIGLAVRLYFPHVT